MTELPIGDPRDQFAINNRTVESFTQPLMTLETRKPSREEVALKMLPLLFDIAQQNYARLYNDEILAVETHEQKNNINRSIAKMAIENAFDVADEFLRITNETRMAN